MSPCEVSPAPALSLRIRPAVHPRAGAGWRLCAAAAGLALALLLAVAPALAAPAREGGAGGVHARSDMRSGAAVRHGRPVSPVLRPALTAGFAGWRPLPAGPAPRWRGVLPGLLRGPVAMGRPLLFSAQAEAPRRPHDLNRRLMPRTEALPDAPRDGRRIIFRPTAPFHFTTPPAPIYPPYLAPERGRVRAGPDLDVPGLHRMLAARGFRDIKAAIRRGETFLVEAIGPRGEKVRLVVQAATGEILGVRVIGW